MSLPSITELLAEFDENSSEEYVYRGQSRDYPVLLPSAFRGLADAVSDDPGACALSRGRVIAQRTRRQEEQSLLRAYWIKRFGLSLGSLLAQQYLVHSEVIDVTTDPKVAAFFATRRGCSYCHLDSSTEPGVLLRWKKPAASRDLTDLRRDLTVGMLHPKTDSSNASPIPVKYKFASPGTEDYTFVRDDPNAFLVLRPEIFTLKEIRTVLAASIDSEKGSLHPPHWMFEYFPTSRWAAQSGGLLRPTMRFPARFKIDGQVFRREKVPETDLELATNITVVAGMPDRVVDAYTIGPPERFQFRHSSQSVDIDPEMLFPSPKSDLMFLVASILAWVTQGEYFDEARANFPWEPNCGVLDRGFYPETVTEDYLRRECNLFKALRTNPPASLRGTAGIGLDGVTH